MNTLLWQNFKDTPERIVHHPLRGQVDRELLGQVTQSGVAKAPLPPYVLARLAWRPALVADMLCEDILSDTHRHLLVGTPLQAINVVAHRAELAPFYVDTILKDAEAAEQLFYLSKMLTPEVPIAVNTEAILASVADRPAAQLRILSVYDKERFKSVRSTLSAQVDEKKLDGPYWALAWLARNPAHPTEPLDAKLVEVLARDEGAAYMAIRWLRDQCVEPEVWADLESAITTPRWAYQSLLDGLIIQQTGRVEKLLIEHPGWLVEFLEDSKASAATVHTFYMSSSAAACEHELIADLHHWYGGRTITASVKRGSKLF